MPQDAYGREPGTKNYGQKPPVSTPSRLNNKFSDIDRNTLPSVPNGRPVRKNTGGSPAEMRRTAHVRAIESKLKDFL